MLILVALHFVAAALAPALVAAFGRRAFYLLSLVPGISFVWLAWKTTVVAGSSAETIVEIYNWIPALDVSIAFTLTTLRWVMGLLVTGIGAIVLFYCAHYFKAGDTEAWRFSAVMTAFAGTMLGLVLSDDLIVMYVFWEATTIFSYLLVGHNPERKANRRAAMNALLVTTFGGLAMLIGIVILGSTTGTYSVQAIIADPPAGDLSTIAVFLLLIGALSKSALVPFHFWLPGAMAAPTPVSAYLHAAAMVKAGVFLVALIAPAFATVAGWRETLIALGVTTMIIGGLRALRQYDVKLLLAYGTVSQLGFLILICGLGTRATATAGIAMVCAHALFKAALFLIVGVVDRRTGTRDLRLLSGMRRTTPKTLFAATLLAAASMAGIPPLFGFVTKESVFAAILDLGYDTTLHPAWTWATVIGLTLGSLLTVAYTARFVWGIYGDKPGVSDCVPRRPVNAMFIAPAALLSLIGFVIAFTGGPITAALQPYGEQFAPGYHETHLALWHGFGPPLLMSVIALVGGLLLFRFRQPVTSVQRRFADRFRLPDAERAYYALMRGIDRLSVEVTGSTQRGSLPVYLSVILLVFIGLVGTAAVLGSGDIRYHLYDTRAQVLVVVLTVAAAVATVRSRRRIRAVLLAGATGYGTALLFMLHGAPDLALTQVLIETVTLVVFVLVLRRLPKFFSDRPLTRSRYFRVGIGTATGIVVAGVAFIAASARTATPISVDFPRLAKEFGGGLNVVNVTLVDIRAWDTMGELSVLVVAATGVASLIFLINSRAARIRTVAQRDVPTRFTGRTFLQSGRAVDPEQRSVVFEVVTRVVFHPIIIFSLYLTLAGHNLPGGGFAGGLVAGMALMVRYLAGGRLELDEAAPVDAGHVLGAGLAVATISALIPLLFGGEPLQSAIFDLDLGVFGTLHLVTSAFFDFGVYLVVIGLMLDILRSLGGGIDRQGEDADANESEGVLQ